MSVTSEQKLVTMAENYYLDLRGSFDESIDKVAGRGRVTQIQTPLDTKKFPPAEITLLDIHLN